MKILIAMDSFKESMTSEEACGALNEGVLKVFKDGLLGVLKAERKNGQDNLAATVENIIRTIQFSRRR